MDSLVPALSTLRERPTAARDLRCARSGSLGECVSPRPESYPRFHASLEVGPTPIVRLTDENLDTKAAVTADIDVMKTKGLFGG